MAQLLHTHEKHSNLTQRICKSQAHLTVPHFKSTTHGQTLPKLADLL